MNINGISSSGTAMPYGGKSTNNAELRQLETKLNNAIKEVNDLKKESGTGGSKEVKEEIAKKEQEIVELKKQIQELKSKEKEQSKSIGQDENKVNNGKTGDTQQAKSLGNAYIGNVIDEYI